MDMAKVTAIKEVYMKKVSPGDKELITPAEAIDYYTLSWRKMGALMDTKNNFTVKYYDDRSLIIRREFEKYLMQHPELRRKPHGKHRNKERQ
jgi:hypothetical protein